MNSIRHGMHKFFENDKNPQLFRGRCLAPRGHTIVSICSLLLRQRKSAFAVDPRPSSAKIGSLDGGV